MHSAVQEPRCILSGNFVNALSTTYSNQDFRRFDVLDTFNLYSTCVSEESYSNISNVFMCHIQCIIIQKFSLQQFFAMICSINASKM